MRFLFASTLAGLPWGASEELWSRAASRLLAEGHRVTLLGHRPDPEPKQEPTPLATLEAAGARRGRLWHAVGADLTLVSVSYAWDDLRLARRLGQLRLPYALLVHCASPDDWITEPRLGDLRRAYGRARRVFWVSAENRRIVQRQLARPLPRSTVVDNPLAVAPEHPLPWPGEGAGGGPEEPSRPGRLELACVGRLHCRSKGQDLVLDVLARERWRRRELAVTFWGRDQGNGEQLRRLAGRRGLGGRVRFAGFTSTPEEIWRRCHGLLLPSRYDGMPMVTAEAMLCGRVPVVTARGRNPEWVEDGVTGFLAAAPTADEVDAALERAWRAWRTPGRFRALGRRAAERLRHVYDPRPVATFADHLRALAATGRAEGDE